MFSDAWSFAGVSPNETTQWKWWDERKIELKCCELQILCDSPNTTKLLNFYVFSNLLAVASPGENHLVNRKLRFRIALEKKIPIKDLTLLIVEKTWNLHKNKPALKLLIQSNKKSVESARAERAIYILITRLFTLFHKRRRLRRQWSLSPI